MEKGGHVEPAASTVIIPKDSPDAEPDANFWTRNGLNAESFKMRHYGHGIVEMERPLKPRHLHMIAIGGSIGAGFFVGSGAAFSKGVSSLSSAIFRKRASKELVYLTKAQLIVWLAFANKSCAIGSR